MKPLATVMIPTYNYGHLIGEALDSLISQDFPASELEAVVIDDGSTDDTRDIVARYKDRVVYARREHAGKTAATRTGIELARGKYIFNLDSDDVFLPHKVRRVVEAFETNGAVALVSHPVVYWYPETGAKQATPLPDRLRDATLGGAQYIAYALRRQAGAWAGMGSAFAGRAAAVKKIVFGEDLDIFVDEYLGLATMLQGEVHFVGEPLSLFRAHRDSFSRGLNHGDAPERLREQVAARRAILKRLSSHSEFDDELKTLLALRVHVYELAAKDVFGEKTLSDIAGLWLRLTASLGVMGGDALHMLKTYFIAQRSLPTPLLRALRRLKYNERHAAS